MLLAGWVVPRERKALRATGAAAIVRRQRRTLDGIFAFDFTLELALHAVDSVCEYVVGVRYRVGDVLHGQCPVLPIGTR